MADRPVFILGVGAEKSGTTWVQSELWRHPQIGFAPAELHVWSMQYLRLDPETHRFARHIRVPWIEQRLQRLPSDHPEYALRLAELADFDLFDAMRRDPSGYAPYFQAMLAANPDVCVVGEKTPAYALLEREHFAELRGVLEDAGFAVRPVFIMRDPVSRVVSSYRSRLYRNGIPVGRASGPELRAFAHRSSTQLLTRYERTIDALVGAFGEDACFFGLYEELVRPDGLDPLVRHLGLEPRAVDPTQRVNETWMTWRPPASAVRALRLEFAETYRRAAERFGADRIREVWPHA